MSDLLGSLLKSMEKPPTVGMSKEQKLAKKQEAAFKKIQEEEKKKLREFRKEIEMKINQFVNNESETRLKFEPMDKVHMAIVHDVSDCADLTAYSFGIENIDRYSIVYKRDSLPSEEELDALRKGEEYDPDKIALMKLLKHKEEKEDLLRSKDKINPTSNYQDKYQHLIGNEAGKKTAKMTTLNEKFGVVPSSLKRDQRSIEETLNDIRKKKQKANERDQQEI